MNNFNDLNEYVDTLGSLSSNLYDEKVNVNEVANDLISTHVTAEDLNNIKSAITVLADNVNEINKHLISSVTDTSLDVPGLFSKGNITYELNLYLANEYIRKNQLIIDDHLVNDSVANLDDTYLRSKNIFVDGYKISTSSPYNLVSYSQLNLIVGGLTGNFVNALGDIKTLVINYITNLNASYNDGRYISINENREINCTLTGDGTIIDINSSDQIYIKPATTNGYVLKTVNGVVQWDEDLRGQNGSTYYPGTFISIDNSNKIDCTLTEGNYVSIITDTTEGKSYINVDEASIERKGVVQLVDSITEENKNRNDLAVTPAAIKESDIGMEEHILGGQGVRDADPAINEPQGMKTGQTAGWIKYPSLRSTVYPGMCLAEAWGWTAPKFMSTGHLDIPITKMLDDLGVLGSYCVFHHIIYVDLDTISIGTDGHADINYELAFGPPTDDGTDIKGFSFIHTHVINHYSGNASGFQVFWKIKGYVKADLDETWEGEQIEVREPVSITATTTPKGSAISKTKNFTSVLTDTAANVVPIGYTSGSNLGYEVVAYSNWSLNRLPREYTGQTVGKYQFHNLRTWVYGHLNDNYCGAFMYADFENAELDIPNGQITNVTIYRCWKHSGFWTTASSWTRLAKISTLYFDPNNTSLQAFTFKDATNTSQILSGKYDNTTMTNGTTERYNWASTIGKITVTQTNVKIVFKTHSFYRHEGKADADVYHSPKNSAYVEFVYKT